MVVGCHAAKSVGYRMQSVPNKSSKEMAWTGALGSAPFVPPVLAAHCRCTAMSAFDAQSWSNISSNLGIPQ